MLNIESCYLKTGLFWFLSSLFVLLQFLCLVIFPVLWLHTTLTEERVGTHFQNSGEMFSVTHFVWCWQVCYISLLCWVIFLLTKFLQNLNDEGILIFAKCLFCAYQVDSMIYVLKSRWSIAFIDSHRLNQSCILGIKTTLYWCITFQMCS